MLVSQAVSIEWACGHAQHLIVGDDMPHACQSCYSPDEPLVEFVDGMRVVCWICKKPIKPEKAPRALCAKCGTGGGLGPYT